MVPSFELHIQPVTGGTYVEEHRIPITTTMMMIPSDRRESGVHAERGALPATTS